MAMAEVSRNVWIGNIYVDLLRQWDKLEKNIAPSPDQAVPILDIDVAPKDLKFRGIPIKHRYQVGLRLEDQRGSIDKTDPDGEYLRAKIDCSLAYHKALENGVPPDLGQYLMDTMGITLQRVPEAEIEEQYAKVQRMFSDLDSKTSQLGYSPKGWEYMCEEYRLDETQVLQTFNTLGEKSLKILFGVLGRNFRINSRIETSNVDEPWLFYIDGDRSGFRYRLNQHPRHRNRYFRGTDQRMPIHETTAHGSKAWSYRINLDNSVITNPVYGAGTVPGPEQWGEEGVADTLALWVPKIYELFDKHGVLSFEHQLLARLVYNNVHFDIIKGNVSDLVMKKFVQEYLPGEDDEQVKRALRSRRTGIIYPSYWGAYEDGTVHFRRWANQLSNSNEDRTDLLRALYEKPMTAQQIKSMVSQKLDRSTVAA